VAIQQSSTAMPLGMGGQQSSTAMLGGDTAKQYGDAGWLRASSASIEIPWHFYNAVYMDAFP